MSDRSVRRSIAFARFPGVIRGAARDFHRLFGLTAVTTFGSTSADRQTCRSMAPPVHPLCARLLRNITNKPPCEVEWKKHLELAERKRCCRIHTCPLGLRCASLPIAAGDDLLGLVKLVSGPGIPKERFRSLVGLLETVIARPCHDLQVFVLQEKVETLQGTVNRLQHAKRPAGPIVHSSQLTATKVPAGADSPQAQTVISQVLDYLNQHYADGDLTLVQVAGAVGRNQKYVSHLFVQHLGERMRPYINALRVRRACGLLLQTNRSIEQIGRECGFAQAVRFRHAFRRTIGVTASDYRQIFTAET
jgi:AraC-like DNA-binding protein